MQEELRGEDRGLQCVL
uniref:Uncharacterized protein n=1 Tax=Anguilla anguilla TaxID=7936 RepID=A0A0E9W6E6_ANGAN